MPPLLRLGTPDWHRLSPSVARWRLSNASATLAHMARRRVSTALICSGAILLFGSACDNPPQESAPTDAGTDRGMWPFDVGVPDSWPDGYTPPCESVEGLHAGCDYVAAELHLTRAAGGAGGAGGFGGEGGAPALGCRLPTDDWLSEDVDLDTVNVALDCMAIPYLPADATPAAGASDTWHFDDPQEPRGVVLSESACAAVHAENVGRIDLVLDCPRVNAEL